jgi:serine/threonine-protein kinase RsbT
MLDVHLLIYSKVSMIAMLSKPVTFGFENEKDVAEARDMASEMAAETGFDKTEEIAGNALKFAGRGTVTIGLTDNRKGLQITVHDRGCGIRNIKKAMEEGYSSRAGSLGMGLNAAKRAMDEISVKSKAENGTTVIMKRYLPLPEDEIEYGIISLNDERYPVNGDAWVIKEFEGDKALLAVIDGTGNGFNANKAANFVKGIVEENYRSGLPVIVRKCHKKIKKTFDTSSIMSCAMGLLLLKPRTLEYVGVGDIDIHVTGTPEKIHFQNQRGVVGDIRLPDLRLQKHRCGRNIIAIMCSDGIMPRFSGDRDLPLDKSAQHIADFIMKNHIREYGDATVLVVKRKR